MVPLGPLLPVGPCCCHEQLIHWGATGLQLRMLRWGLTLWLDQSLMRISLHTHTKNESNVDWHWMILGNSGSCLLLEWKVQFSIFEGSGDAKKGKPCWLKERQCPSTKARMELRLWWSCHLFLTPSALVRRWILEVQTWLKAGSSSKYVQIPRIIWATISCYVEILYMMGSGKWQIIIYI